MDAELVEHDLRRPLPGGLAAGFDVACTDPPYTVAGAELFLSRAVAGLAPEPGGHVFFSFGARRPEETLRAQELIGAMGLTIRGLWPGFNEYLGAGVLAGTSHLYHLRSTAAARPLVEGDFSGPAVHGRGPGRRHPALPVRRLPGRARGRPGRPVAADRRPAGGRLPAVRRRRCSGRCRCSRDDRAPPASCQPGRAT